MITSRTVFDPRTLYSTLSNATVSAHTKGVSRRHQRHMKRSLRLMYLRLKRLQGRPDKIARGIAVGAFTGVMPLFGVQTIFAIALSTLVRGNTIAAAAATWVSNPLTFVPLYMLNFRMGQHILGTQDLFMVLDSAPSLGEFLRMGMDCIVTLTVGCLALGLPLAGVSYLLSLTLIRFWQRRQRHQRRRPGKDVLSCF